jgi:hypothetical protein
MVELAPNWTTETSAQCLLLSFKTIISEKYKYIIVLSYYWFSIEGMFPI